MYRVEYLEDEDVEVSAEQLADYVAMVTLAQIDPDADTRGYASILNLFQTPDAAPGQEGRAGPGR